MENFPKEWISYIFDEYCVKKTFQTQDRKLRKIKNNKLIKTMLPIKTTKSASHNFKFFFKK